MIKLRPEYSVLLFLMKKTYFPKKDSYEEGGKNSIKETDEEENFEDYMDDYDDDDDFTLDEELYVFSDGKVHPTPFRNSEPISAKKEDIPSSIRFLQSNNKLPSGKNINPYQRGYDLEKRLKKKKDLVGGPAPYNPLSSHHSEEYEPYERPLKEIPSLYFFALFAQHETENCVTFANFFSLFKYYRFFDDVTADDATRTGIIYPEKLDTDVNFIISKWINMI